MIDLGNRVVLITGAGGAIGSATARTISRAGGRVLLHDVRAEAVEALAEELGSGAHALVADLADPVATERLWPEALAVHGRIDVLINNAGIYPPAELDGPFDEWLRVWMLSLGREPRRSGHPVPRGGGQLLGSAGGRDHHQHGQPAPPFAARIPSSGTTPPRKRVSSR